MLATTTATKKWSRRTTPRLPTTTVRTGRIATTATIGPTVGRGVRAVIVSRAASSATIALMTKSRQPRPHINGGADSLPIDVLPPAIGADDMGEADSEETAAPRPRRRSRGPRPADGDEEIAPAA